MSAHIDWSTARLLSGSGAPLTKGQEHPSLAGVRGTPVLVVFLGVGPGEGSARAGDGRLSPLLSVISSRTAADSCAPSPRATHRRPNSVEFLPARVEHGFRPLSRVGCRKNGISGWQ